MTVLLSLRSAIIGWRGAYQENVEILDLPDGMQEMAFDKALPAINVLFDSWNSILNLLSL